MRGVSSSSALGLAADFKYRGGPLIGVPRVHLHFIGTNLFAEYIKTFAGWITGPNAFTNNLAQYGVGAGSLIAVTSEPFSGNLTKDALESKIKNLGRDENVYAILLGDGVSYIGQEILCAKGDNAFGFHDYFVHRLKAWYYMVVPYLTDACLKLGCASDAGCSLHLGQPQLDRITQVFSHEYAELTSDPRVDGWNAGSGGWENGDICNGSFCEIDGWNVQRIYSKASDSCSSGSAQKLAALPLPRFTADQFSAIMLTLWLGLKSVFV